MTIRISRIWVCAFVLAACVLVVVLLGYRGPRLPELGSSDVIVAFGDSLTEGVGADDSESYPAILVELIGRRVINAGVSGELSREGLERLPGVLAQYRPAIVIICFGGNDFLRGEPEDRVAGRVSRMVEVAQERGVGVALIGVPKPGLLLSAAVCYETVAKQHGVPCEGDALAEIMSSRPLKSDRVHPNAKGYRVLAEAVAEMLREAGAVE